MNQKLKRYDHSGYDYLPGSQMKEHEDGDYVRHSDYEKLQKQLEKAEEALKFYSNEMNYSVDDYRGVSGDMTRRCILYSDCEERNDIYSYAGQRARQYFKEKEKK